MLEFQKAAPCAQLPEKTNTVIWSGNPTLARPMSSQHYGILIMAHRMFARMGSTVSQRVSPTYPTVPNVAFRHKHCTSLLARSTPTSQYLCHSFPLLSSAAFCPWLTQDRETRPFSKSYPCPTGVGLGRSTSPFFGLQHECHSCLICDMGWLSLSSSNMLSKTD